jgi:general secretion pathway protein A
MYQEFYGLREKPFSLTPDPQFLYLSESHRTAIDSLLYGIDQREGFIVITGNIGTGKTTICRAVLEKMDKNVKTAVIFNSLLTERELLESILQDLGLPSKGRSKKELIDELNKFLLDQLSQGRNVAIIIDEAQNLSIPVLEQIRMLSNLETEKEKMLQIILLGQLELDQKLNTSQLKQLSQRIAIRHQLTALTPMEMESYINQRLMVAGGQGNITFSKSALDEIYGFSKGIPRLINLICDRALLGGFVEQTYHISKKIVKKARRSLLGIEENAGPRPVRTVLRRPIPLSFALIIILILLLAGLELSSPEAKYFIWHKIRNVYDRISDAAEQSISKSVAKETVKLSSHPVRHGTDTLGPFGRALGPERVEGLPGDAMSLHNIAPLDPAYPALGGAGYSPVKNPSQVPYGGTN